MNSSAAISKRERILGGLWGALVGDALGVPVEFKDRESLQTNPVKGMRGFGSHDQPPGTWSDDGALTLCTVESLINKEFDIEDLGRRFVRWMNDEMWTATGVVFDVGGTTADALMQIAAGMPADKAGRKDEYSNGNGSLMRMLPTAVRFADLSSDQLVERVEKASAITHGHARSKMACVLYSFVVRGLTQGAQPQEALEVARVEFVRTYEQVPDFVHFRHLLKDEMTALPEGEILSTGYVLHTLHASLWSLATTSSFEDCVLRAVNLGGDTDTTGCVAGGLAGVLYGANAVPEEWIRSLARHDEVASLFSHFADVIFSQT